MLLPLFKVVSIVCAWTFKNCRVCVSRFWDAELCLVCLQSLCPQLLGMVPPSLAFLHGIARMGKEMAAWMAALVWGLASAGYLKRQRFMPSQEEWRAQRSKALFNVVRFPCWSQIAPHPYHVKKKGRDPVFKWDTCITLLKEVRKLTVLLAKC